MKKLLLFSAIFAVSLANAEGGNIRNAKKVNAYDEEYEVVQQDDPFTVFGNTIQCYSDSCE